MRRYFKGGLFTLGAMFLTMALMVSIGIVAGDSSAIGSAAIGVFTFTFCLSPLALLFTAGTGIGTLINWINSRNSVKKKNDFQSDFADFDFEDDASMEAIMERLSPAQQDYLQEQLRNQRLGVGNDGELTSMDDLLNRFEDDSQ